jgi:hypothetical protein
MFLFFYVSLDLASVFFLLARSGRKNDGHIINIRMFIKFFMFFFCIGKAKQIHGRGVYSIHHGGNISTKQCISSYCGPLVRTPPPPVRRHHQIAASGRDP